MGQLRPWTAGVVVAALVATAAFGGLFGLAALGDWLLASREGLSEGELWRLLTGPLVHADSGHLVRDLPIFAGLAWVLEGRLGRAFGPVLLGALVVPTLAVLGLQADMAAYLGLSGAINTLLLVFVAGQLLGDGTAKAKLATALLGAAHLGKLGYEAFTGGLLFPLELPPGVEAAPTAHLAGAVLGLGFAAALSLQRYSPRMSRGVAFGP